MIGVLSGQRNQSSQPQMYPEFSTLRNLSCGPLKDNSSSHSRKMSEFSASKLGSRSFFKYSHVQFENGKCVIGSVSNLLVYHHRSLAAHVKPSAVFQKTKTRSSEVLRRIVLVIGKTSKSFVSQGANLRFQILRFERSTGFSWIG